MIAAFDNVENVPRFHLRAHAFEQIERTKRIARALDEEDRRAQSAQNFVAKFGAITHRAKRISKANERIDFFLQRDVTPDSPAHALADQNCRSIVNMSSERERFAMCGNQLRQTIGPLPLFAQCMDNQKAQRDRWWPGDLSSVASMDGWTPRLRPE